MDDPHKTQPVSPEPKNFLPDVVHSQHIPAIGTVQSDETFNISDRNLPENVDRTAPHDISEVVAVDVSENESISEHIPSKMEYSLSGSDYMAKSHESHTKCNETLQDSSMRHNSLNIMGSAHDPSPHSSSWPVDVNAHVEVHNISEESPVNLELSSEFSKAHSSGNKSQIELAVSTHDSSRSEFLDSLNKTEKSHLSDEGAISLEKDSLSSDKVESQKDSYSGSDEIIKLDIRGSGVPKYQFPAEQIIFGPPPEGSDVINPDMEQIPMFNTLLSPFLVEAGDSVKVEEIFDSPGQLSKDPSLEKSSSEQSYSSDKSEQKDLLVEELTVHDAKERDMPQETDFVSFPNLEEPAFQSTPQPKHDEPTSFNTTTTDYKTICDEFNIKLVHLEDAITQRDERIKALTHSLQLNAHERDELRNETEHLTNEVQNLQHRLGEQPHSDHDTVKGQISDFMKYESLIKDDSTKFYSAVMSDGCSAKSSNSEKDMDREEILVNYSKSDIKSSSSSEDFVTDFDLKLMTEISKFDEFIEENHRNKLRESLLHLFCDEVGKIRLDLDTELKELEVKMQQDKQAYTLETRKLRELLESVKSGDANIEALRKELSLKHEKEMANLRTYFEKKCSDMERSYSEEVNRGVACVSPSGSGCSLDAWQEAAGDAGRRARSADLPGTEGHNFELVLKQTRLKHEQQLDQLKAEHVAYVTELQTRHREGIATLEEQVTQLKAHIQTAENTEHTVPMYQQDIDLELEKDRAIQERLERARQEVIHLMQEQIQVLLSDPDAELSSWPLELVALRDKIHGEAARTQLEKELSSLREDLSSSGEADKWKQRRNQSFDQNRHIEEVTKERDELKRVAVTLQQVIAQLVAYCAAAEDELNKSVLAELLTHFLSNSAPIRAEDSRPSTPGSDALNTSLTSRHVHFAPDLTPLALDCSLLGLVTNDQRDLSAAVQTQLHCSLQRLRAEAQALLDLSNRPRLSIDARVAEASQVKVTELVDELDARLRSCDNCELHRKSMEDAMSECLQRENLLRSDLEAARMQIANLMTHSEPALSTDLIAEGYGLAQYPRLPVSLPARPSPRTPPPPDSARSLSLGSQSPRERLPDIDAILRERDDARQQLEAANRQLRSTRQFVDEQATEREAERDEFVARLAELKDENSRLATRLQSNARILNEVEQLEAQTREMNQIITELEERKSITDSELTAKDEKISLQSDIIANLETQLEQKTAHESQILQQLETMKSTIDERDSKLRALLGELEALRSERAEQSDVSCVRCQIDNDVDDEEFVEKVKEQARWLEQELRRRTHRLERIHEVCSTSCSEPSEDVSLRDQKNAPQVMPADEAPPSPFGPPLPQLAGVWESLASHGRAEDMALKRIADLEMQRTQLKNVAQEVRAERDVLQARMSEQALRISSLAARLEQQRHNAAALAHDATSQLSVQLHDSRAEVQRLKEELESKDKQLSRLKQGTDERDKLSEGHDSLYGNNCNPKDKVIIVERELTSVQTRAAQLEALVRTLEADKDDLHAALRDATRTLAEREAQMQELLALKLDDENKSEQKSEVIEGKNSARTLSDIVSISDFDEQDLQMRRVEMKGHNASLGNAPYPTEYRDKAALNRTLPPEAHRPNMSSLNIDYMDHFDLTSFTPRGDSLPVHLTSTQYKDVHKQYKRNVNETTVFGNIDGQGDSVKHSTTLNIPDNTSMYPNRDTSDNKNVSVEPKKIDFSMEPSHDNKTADDHELTSLRELGIDIDMRPENFPDILTQLKHVIKKSRSELDICKSDLKNAEEQLCEFPALKEEVEELKNVLENTVATMENDKKFYENQLENFTSNKKLLEQRIAEVTQEVDDKTKDLHLLKEDILRRENMILELAKEKRNLTNKLAELEVKIDELQGRNNNLEKHEAENIQLRQKISELHKLEQLVSEKNQQIDSLNQHLDRLDNLQRCLNDKTEEFDNLKEAFEEKSNELFQMQDTVEALNRDLANVHEENNNLNISNKDLKLKLTKLEKEQENQSIKLQSSEVELERVNSLNNELSSKIDELKQLNDKLKDKETEIEILNEDINSFHEEIANLKEQLKMVSRSPSPRNKNGEDKSKIAERQATNDKKQMVKIRKQVSLLQHELDFNKKELNDKAFELAKAKLDLAELKTALSQGGKDLADRDVANKQLVGDVTALRAEIHGLREEKHTLSEQLSAVNHRLREESNINELKQKLQEKNEQCLYLEADLKSLKEMIERRAHSSPHRELVLSSSVDAERALVLSGARSPTAELERAVRDQLNYSHRLDDDIMEQILSASSDNDEIPRLALNTSKSTSSIHSSTSERLNRMKMENDKLTMQVNNLEARLRDKDALINEVNRIRDQLVQECQSAKLRYEAERDNSGRLQLLLDTQRETAESLQQQDTNMIQTLKKRLESGMQNELELQQTVQQCRARLSQLQRAMPGQGADTDQTETIERLQSEISILKSKLEGERSRYCDLQALTDQHKLSFQRELETRHQQCSDVRNQLTELRRLKHETGVELLRAKELLNIQAATIAQLEKQMSAGEPKPAAMTDFENHQHELVREISTLKQCLLDSSERRELMQLRADNRALGERLASLEQPAPERDQAIRYLHGRCLRLESCRKALVWQKRYLQRVLAGYSELENRLRLPNSRAEPSSGKKRFKCIATVVIIVLRMGFLVRRRQQVRTLSANCLLRTQSLSRAHLANTTPCSPYTSTSPPSRDRPAPRDLPAHPARPAAAAARVAHLRLNLPASPALGDATILRSPFYGVNSPREESFLLSDRSAVCSTPRSEVANYMGKLELVSRCLSHAMETRDQP